MKALLSFILFFIGLSFGFAQSTMIVGEYSNQGVSLKWIPHNYSEMKQFIANGSVIYREKVYNDLTFDQLVFDEQLAKVTSKFNSIATSSLSDSLKDKLTVLMSPFVEPVNLTTEEKDFSFLLASVENSCSNLISEYSGLYFRDETIEPNSKYVYKIVSGQSKPVYFSISTDKYTAYPHLTIDSLSIDRKKTVEIQFETRKQLAFGFGYYIERSEGDTLHGKVLNSLPYVRGISKDVKPNSPDYFRDDFSEDGLTMYYRICGLSYFGAKQMYSTWTKITVPHFIYGQCLIDTVEINLNERKILGHIDIDSGEVNHVHRLVLLRSKEVAGIYEQIDEIPYNQQNFVFKVQETITGDHNYYQVVALSIDGDSVKSAPRYIFTLDQEAPLNPHSLKGKVDSLGIVRLSWTAPMDQDLLGYRVFRGNALSDEFVEKTTQLSLATEFVDTVLLDNLTSEVYYFVKAIDHNYNTGIPSDTLLLMKPDTISPVASFIVSISEEDTYLSLSLIPSSSTDFSKSILFKQLDNGFSDTLTIYSVPDFSRFIDSVPLMGMNNLYFIQTFDKSGNVSTSAPINYFYEPGYRKAMTDFNGRIDRVSRGILLTWMAPAEGVYNYTIYRKSKGGRFEHWKTLPADKTSFIDKMVAIDNEYEYYIQYMTMKGILGLPSQTVKILY